MYRTCIALIIGFLTMACLSSCGEKAESAPDIPNDPPLEA